MNLSKPETIRFERIVGLGLKSRRESEWEKLVSCESGIYFYRPRTAIRYPFGSSRIAYIGKAKDLAHRLAWHFRVDMSEGRVKNRLLDDHRTLAWFYQNYFLGPAADTGTDISVVKCHDEEDIERLCIGVFAVKYGAMPLCNATVQRTKLKETYSCYHRKPIIRSIERALSDLSA